MKTLDEVIKAYELCLDKQIKCSYCPYHADGCPESRKLDALHYLRELKLFRQTPLMQGIHKAQRECALYHVDNWGEDEPSERNKPLTWDELKSMEGKPVWATFDNENGTWYIAKVYDDEVVLYEWGQEFGERISGAWDYTPKRWQAYRKERDENAE